MTRLSTSGPPRTTTRFQRNAATRNPWRAQWDESEPRVSAPSRRLELGRVGESVRRIDAIPKVTGEFAYSSDLFAAGMLYGHTVRSPHSAAQVKGIITVEAKGMPGVHAVLTHRDVPGEKRYGLEFPDQPVLAMDEVRYFGEPVALVAAEHPEQARRAAAAIQVDYIAQKPIADPEKAPEAVRELTIRHGDPDAPGEVTVTGYYELGIQDQAFLGPESGLAVPDGKGGVDIYVATQWLHVDRDQVAPCLGLPPSQVRIHLAGVGGAFGGREDLSMQIHGAMLALKTNRPVKMVYNREESFAGHVHRHPARIWCEHRATRDGKLTNVRMKILLDGGAYASSSTAVCSNAASFAAGPYNVPNALIECRAVFTNNPPCGAMRGFGAVQTCFAAEAQMDKLAVALEMDPVELRIKNAIGQGDTLPTGQRIEGSLPVEEVLRRCAAIPEPDPRSSRATRSGSPAAPATRRAATASAAGSVSRSATRTSATRRGSTTTARPASASTPMPAATSSRRCTPPRPRSARASSTSSARSHGPSCPRSRTSSSLRTPPPPWAPPAHPPLHARPG